MRFDRVLSTLIWRRRSLLPRSRKRGPYLWL